MKIGETVHQLREKRHWSQEELAGRAKTTAANISRIETGKHGPSLRLLEAIAYAFDMKLYQLMALAEGESLPTMPPDYDDEENGLLTHFRQMTPEQRAIFQAVGVNFTKHDSQ